MIYRLQRTFPALRLLLLVLTLSSCAARAAIPTLVPEPTGVPLPSETPLPTATPGATNSPVPTKALSPTPAGIVPVVPTRLAGADLPKPIVFIDLRQQIARLDPDGRLTELTNEPGNMLDFDVGPAGSELAFLSAQSDGMLLIRSDSKGEARAELASGTLRAPLFDPAGEHILFAVDVAGAKADQTTLAAGIWSIALSGGEPTQLVENVAPQTDADGQVIPGLLYAPWVWSPDGKLLLLMTSPDFGPDLPAGDIGSIGLALYDSADGSVRSLIPPGGNPRLCITPSWAADSAAVLCATPYSVGDDTPALFRLDLTTGDSVDLLPISDAGGMPITVSGALGGQGDITVLMSYHESASASRAAFERFGSDPAQRKILAPLDHGPDASSALLWASDGGGAVFSTGGERPQLLWQPFDGGPARILVDGYIGRMRWGR